MKTIYRISVFLMCLLPALNLIASGANPGAFIGIHVVITSKAYWDGPSKSCLPRDKGGCCHIWVDGMVSGTGEISGEMVMDRGKILQLTVRRGKGMNNETYRKYFSDGNFNLGGPITFDPDVLSKLGLAAGYAVPPGTYPVAISGDQMTITFK